MTARCSVHDAQPSIGACARCGRFICEACADGRRVGFCSTCAARPDVRLEISRRAKAVLWLAIGALVVPPLILASWWAERSASAVFLEADEPLLLGARWIRWTVLVGWTAAGALALW